MLERFIFVLVLTVLAYTSYGIGYLNGRSNEKEKRDNQLRFINRISLRR